MKYKRKNAPSSTANNTTFGYIHCGFYTNKTDLEIDGYTSKLYDKRMKEIIRCNYAGSRIELFDSSFLPLATVSRISDATPGPSASLRFERMLLNDSADFEEAAFPAA